MDTQVYIDEFLCDANNAYSCSNCPKNKNIHDSKDILEPCGYDDCLILNQENK